ncbi:MAG: prepilin-type N-terminal cleavage/methylation domain-containing protein [Bryobacteraceae bacterium]|jgi:prepilin-type N-terminal cleavage/methylation domain-containing protein
MKRAAVRSRQAGVTLIEVLIAVTLLSALSVAMLLSLEVALKALHKTDEKLLADRRVAGAQRVLEQELEGLVPVMTVCAGHPNLAAYPFVFFQAEPQTMRLVSTFSLQQGWRGPARILEMFVIPGEEGKGVRLVVNETAYTRMDAGRACTGITPDPVVGGVVQFTPVVATPTSFVLADQLAYCRFSYFVVPPSPQGRPEPPPEWRASATGTGWPKAIRVEMAPLEADPSRLQPITVTAPIHIHRSWQIQYDDF